MTIICPEEPSNLVTKEVTLTSAGTLSSKISASEKYKVNKLKVTGPMNGTDMLFLRQMAGFDSDYGTFTEGLLSDIDLSDATVVNGGSSHISYNGTAYPTQSKMVPYALFLYSYPVANISSFKMPKSTTNIGFAAFFTCYNLPEMVIPSSVTQIGSQAFENCDGLRKLVCLSSTPPTILSSTFGDVDKKYCKLFVPMGRKSQYQSAANWSLFENIYEIGDVNTDGTPDVSDVVALISYITGNSRSTNSYYDINGDGVTDVSDVVALVSSIVG